MVVGIGARSTHLIFLQGSRFFTRTLALGGNAVTQEVAAEMNLDFAGAEALKLRVCSGQTVGNPAAALSQR